MMNSPPPSPVPPIAIDRDRSRPDDSSLPHRALLDVVRGGLAILCCAVMLLTPSGALAVPFRVWHTETDPATLAALEATARRFDAENPGVETQVLAVGWADLYQRLTLALQARDVPDLLQVQPFMAAYLQAGGHLQPLDDVLDAAFLADVYPAVRDLQEFAGHRYGIATALGISYYSFRTDLVAPAERDAHPRTWADYLAMVRAARQQHPDLAPLLLPANDLHITLLFTEMLASNGGSLFNAAGQPDFMNPRVIQTLAYWRDLFDLVPQNLRNSNYTENFGHYAQGRAATLPCFFGRGTRQIELSAPEATRSPGHFAFFPAPVGPGGTVAPATLDAEPWVVLTRSPHPDVARRFLKFFYRRDNYLQFVGSVPIHLTPIFRSLATSDAYTGLPHVAKWRSYHDELLRALDGGRVLPIFMARTADRNNPALFRLEGSRVVSGMVRDATFGGLSPQDAARNAAARAQDLMRDLPRPNATPARERRSNASWIVGLVVAAIAAAGLLLAAIRRRSQRG